MCVRGWTEIRGEEARQLHSVLKVLQALHVAGYLKVERVHEHGAARLPLLHIKRQQVLRACSACRGASHGTARHALLSYANQTPAATAQRALHVQPSRCRDCAQAVRWARLRRRTRLARAPRSRVHCRPRASPARAPAPSLTASSLTSQDERRGACSAPGARRAGSAAAAHGATGAGAAGSQGRTQRPFLRSSVSACQREFWSMGVTPPNAWRSEMK